MNAQAIFDRIQAKFPDTVLDLTLDVPDPFIFVKTDGLSELAQFMKDEEDLAFDFLESITGVDTTEELHLVYHLFSYKHRHSAVLKIRVAYNDLLIPSLCKVWPAANWHEREQYDLFGFSFEGHPDLRRILLPEDWHGHPLRKTYEYPEEYHGIDHWRPDPKEQFKALDELAAKAAAKVREHRNAETESSP